MLVSAAIPNLVNGVSQQPPTLRLASQGDIQENCSSNAADGLTWRYGTRHLAGTDISPTLRVFTHAIDRSTSERYIVAVTNGAVAVFDHLGNRKTVNMPDGNAYLASADPRTDFVALTLQDYTFIVNRRVTVQARAETAPTRNPEAMVAIRQGNYGRTYSIHLGGTLACSYTTPDGSDPSHAARVDTSWIAERLLTGTIPGGPAAGESISGPGAGNMSPHTVVRLGNVLYGYHALGQNFSIHTEDGFNGQAMVVIKGTIQRFTDLPNQGPEGFVVKVAGDQTSNFDDYWVVFKKDHPNDSTGYWEECVAPGSPLGFDMATMPHVLVREANGTFTFRQGEWKDRSVGNPEAVPDRSFMGRKIRDVFFLRDRLGFLSGGSVSLSRTGEYFNHWPRTLTAVLDDDPIDLDAPSTRAADLDFAVPEGKVLVLWAGGQAQYELGSEGPLTPTTVAIDQTSAFSYASSCRPAVGGNTLYFAVNQDSWTGVHEYYVDTDTKLMDSTDLSGHVPRYIAGRAHRIIAAPAYGFLAVLTDNDPSALYVYQYLTNGRERIQSAWSRWSLGDDAAVMNGEVIGAQLFLLVQRPSGVSLESIPLASGDVDTGANFHYHVDRKLFETQCTVGITGGNTLITMPYADSGDLVVCRRGLKEDFETPEDVFLEILSRPSPSQILVSGQHFGRPLVIGKPFPKRYRFSPIYMREDGSRGNVRHGGRLQLRFIDIVFARAGAFTVEMTAQGRATRRHHFVPKNRETGGTFRVPLMCRNTYLTLELTSDSPLPAYFTGAEWEGFYTARSKFL